MRIDVGTVHSDQPSMPGSCNSADVGAAAPAALVDQVALADVGLRAPVVEQHRHALAERVGGDGADLVVRALA